MNPHFWRTHDGGKTWTEIDNGIAPGAVANSIREDPRKKGLLYAATDTQVWVSFDDGDHWQSLRLDMPAISVRDIEVKDDATCLCSDLVAGTHGRGFWILDDVTPLRQAAEAAAATGRVPLQAGTGDPRALRHQRPDAVAAGSAGRARTRRPAASSTTTCRRRVGRGEARDPRRRAARWCARYSSNDPVRNPDPALDPAAYNKLCQADADARPTARCRSTGRRRSMALDRSAGMHRFSWDLHYDPIGETRGRGRGGANGAVPHRTYPSVDAPWAPPGATPCA